MQEQEANMDKLLDYYNHYDEHSRLADAWGQVEYVRTQRIIARYLALPPAVVLDIGGAAGRYACWLARQGYEVHLVDPVPRHIEQAREASDSQPQFPIASVRAGDARQLPFEGEQADAVLLMGPLYHLVDLQDRQQALAEAFRVLRTGGLLFAAGISRFASAIDGLDSGYYLDPTFRQIIDQDLTDGQHRNPSGNPAYFTDTFFHHPDELRAEVAGAGFEVRGLLAIEGISYMMADLSQNWAVEAHRQFLLALIERIEAEPSLLGASPHLMCVGSKPQ